MAGQVSSHQQGAFSNPQDGQTGSAAVVLANDNANRTTANAHDADATIHVQSSVLAGRPAAGVAQRVWITSDGLRAYVDSGSVWGELAYLSLAAGGTVAAAVTISAGGLAVTGNSTITGTLGGLTGLTVASGGAAVTGNSTVTGTLTVTGGVDGVVKIGTTNALWLTNPTFSSATAGGNGALPAQVAGYLQWSVGGAQNIRIPFYNA